ncbi:hypothetical protein [Shinella zoogloeoides]|uniref:hypothetical protein n=1 Tax=Shinella zoogloeoides TaxID=352475 RepID=UPI0028A71390|nr:hypothetical protein [Shinella zoogloeoides]
MTTGTGKEATIWERGFAPVGFLVLLFALFFSQFPLSGDAATAGHPQRTATEGGLAPSPLSPAGDDLWFPAGSHAERRVAKAKTGLADGDSAGKALLPPAGALLYPFETASLIVFPAAEDAAPASAGSAAFRSRAPPALAA